MGFLDRLRGGGKVTLTMAAEPAEPAPGGQVTVRYDVGGEVDDKDRAVRVGLVGTASYQVEEIVQNQTGGIKPDGSYEPVQTTSHTQKVWRSYELHREETELPAQIGPGQAVFAVPDAAAPSSPAVVTWKAFARVDRARGIDKDEDVQLAVRVPADRLPKARAPRETEDGLTLDDVPVAVRAGDTVTGHLTVNVSDELSVTAVRIRLHRKVTYLSDGVGGTGVYSGDELSFYSFAGDQITEENKVAEVDLTGERDFSPGSIEQLPFSIAVPAGSGPTTGHSYASVEWRVEAVLDRRMRGDLAVDTPLIVH
jgi:hypothetical protein